MYSSEVDHSALLDQSAPLDAGSLPSMHHSELCVSKGKYKREKKSENVNLQCYICMPIRS